VIAVLAFSGMCAAFMQTILTPLQAELPQLLDAPREDTAWVITITLLVSAVFTPISGRLGDMYGKRRIVLLVLALLVVGSIVAALSRSIEPIIVGRALQGVGMGVIPLGISILRDVLPRRRLTSAVALVSATLGVGGALGLPVSALVSEHADWHLLFALAAVLGVIAFVLVLFVVPPTTLRTGGRFDFIGAIGLAIGLTSVLLLVARGNEWGWLTPVSISLAVGGAVVLLLWGVYERRRPDPLIDLVTSARPPVLLTNLASIAMGFAFFAASVVFPQKLTLPTDLGGFGLTLLGASLVLMPSGFVMLIVSQFAGRLERLIGARFMLASGAGALGCGYLAALLLPAGWVSVLCANALIGLGLGLGFAAMPTLIMRAVPPTETAAANGLNTLMRALGTSLASAAVAAVLAQQSLTVDGVTAPTADAFQTAILLGVAAAVLAATLAICIPRGRPAGSSRMSIPDDD
jgi:MFS family permease